MLYWRKRTPKVLPERASGTGAVPSHTDLVGQGRFMTQGDLPQKPPEGRPRKGRMLHLDVFEKQFEIPGGMIHSYVGAIIAAEIC